MEDGSLAAAPIVRLRALCWKGRVGFDPYAHSRAGDLAQLPKAHLHAHLESAVRWSTLREIAAANGVPHPDHLGDGRFVFDPGFGQFSE
jgi:hypothetical protein